MVDARHLGVGGEHALVEQIAEGEIVGMVADRHHRDDLARVEKERQRPLDDDARLDRTARLIDTGDHLAETRVEWIGSDEKAFLKR